MRRDSWFFLGSLATAVLSVSAGALAQDPVKPAQPSTKPTAPQKTPTTTTSDKVQPNPNPPTMIPGSPADAAKKAEDTRRLISANKPVAENRLVDNQLTQEQAYDPNEPPAIAFEPPIADMGEMIADTAKTVTIKIKNVTDKPIRISKAIPGCGCTTPNYPKDPIAPGATGDCEITLRPGNKQGIKLSKKVTFQIEGHAPVVLSVEGQVVAYVNMVPEMIDSPADPTAAGTPPTEVVLESTDGVAFKVTEIVPPIVKNPPMDAKTKHALQVDWSLWNQAGSQPKILFKTDHPKAPNMTMLIKRAITPGSTLPPAAPVTPAGPGTTDLITAVRANDLVRMSALIEKGTDVNERDRAGQRTALYWAAKSGNIAAMEKLIASKADPNTKDRQGRTPLWAAVETDMAAVKYLVEHGADVNARDGVNSTPLLWACGFGKPESVAYLLSKGADPKALDDNGWTPLIWAAGLGQPQTIDTLVKAGADLRAADKQTGDTPLLRGARTGKPESLKILIAAGADVAAVNKAKQTALHLAAASGSADKVQILLAAGANPAAVDEKGWTPLDHAMNRTTGDKTKLLEILKPVSPAPKVETPASK